MEVRTLKINELVPGMILHQDVFITKDELLVEEGTEINLPVFETLSNFLKAGLIEEPFQALVTV